MVVNAGLLPATAAPQKEDALYVDVPEDSTIAERQAVAILSSELGKNGFTLTPSRASAKWVLVVFVRDSTLLNGSTTRGFGQTSSSGLSVGGSKTRLNYQTNTTVHLSLYQAADHVQGLRKPIWDCETTMSMKIFNRYAPVILKNLLDAYGDNYSGVKKLDRDYK
jgi:hypothetical protein